MDELARPVVRSRARLISEPGRMRLSMPQIESPSRRSSRLRARALPDKPADTGDQDLHGAASRLRRAVQLSRDLLEDNLAESW